MNRQQAYQSFVYHGERIYGPLGEKSTYHEEMRRRWAFIIDHKLYKYLPNNPARADATLRAFPDEYFERENVERLKALLKTIRRDEARYETRLADLVREIMGGKE
jgi:hypothetical protein